MEKKFEQQTANCVKVVLFGPESTGKTTLSHQLADHYQTLWVPEYAREYLQRKWDEENKVCEAEDLIPIARGQIEMENALSSQVTELLVCDTDLLETKVYSEAYFGFCDPLIEKYAFKNTYDLYFLTNIDIPWEKDDLRDKPYEREKMFAYFKKALDVSKRPYVLIEGNKEDRLKKAVKEIDQLLKTKQ